MPVGQDGPLLINQQSGSGKKDDDRRSVTFQSDQRHAPVITQGQSVFVIALIAKRAIGALFKNPVPSLQQTYAALKLLYHPFGKSLFIFQRA